jgi:branched-chain amino acid transport system ATP-binding protein
MEPLLRVSGLVKHYGAMCVTDHVDLHVDKGETLALIGPNGAGKTTLIGQISGEVSSDAGTIYLAGKDVTKFGVARRAQCGIGRSYQITSVILSLTVLENIILAVQASQGHCFRFWQPATQTPSLVEPADRIIENLAMGALRDRYAGALSYGQRRQLELAMALAGAPQLLLLDEPMAGLGPGETEDMVKLIAGIKKDYGILLIEHDMGAVFTLADRLSVLCYGKVILTGTPDEVRHSEVVRLAYLGDEELV